MNQKEKDRLSLSSVSFYNKYKEFHDNNISNIMKESILEICLKQNAVKILSLEHLVKEENTRYLKNVSREDLELLYDTIINENYQLGLENSNLKYQVERKWWMVWLPKTIHELESKVIS